MRKLWFIVSTVILLVFAAKSSIAAVTLKQNWQAGQQLVYDTNIDGSLNLQIPASVPTFIAGMPLEISLRGVGKTTLNTLKLNDFGDGTVQIKIDPLSLEAGIMGQKAVIRINNGNTAMTLNGAPQKDAFLDWNLLTNPPATLTFSPQMKVTAFTLNSANTTVATNPATSMNVMAMIQNLILQSLPAVLPTKSLNVGDQWTSDVQFKTSPAPNAPVIKMGSFQFELKDPQTMEGRNLQHITVHGNIDLSSDQSKTLRTTFGASDASASDDGGSQNSKMLSDLVAKHLFDVGQTVDGDLYFDAQAGQFIQADLNVDSQVQTLPDTDEPSTADGFMNFNGTVRLKLSQVVAAKL